MRELIGSFLSNDSPFGRLMTRCGVIIGANIMFILFIIPVFTTGAALTALYDVMLRTLRGDGEINPFRTFWRGFRSNFKQATIVWIIAAALIAFLGIDIRIIGQAAASGSRSGAALAFLRYPLMAMIIAFVILLLYMFPVMAAFEAPIPQLVRSSLYFAMHRPWKIPVIVFFDLFPLYLTYSDPQMMPLYAFLWAFFGFGAIAMLGAYLLQPDFAPYLDAAGEDEHPEGLTEEEKAALEDMERLGM